MRLLLFLLAVLTSFASCKKKDNPAPEAEKGYVKLVLNNEVLFDGEIPSDPYDGEVRYIEDYNNSGVRVVEFNISHKQNGDLFIANISGVPGVGESLPLVDDPDFNPAGGNSSMIIDSPDDLVHLSDGSLLNGIHSISGEIRRESKTRLVLTGQATYMVNYDAINIREAPFYLELRIEKFYDH